ncbi:MAG TPA: hypothetical protein PLA85_09405, partial [Micropepsaceae bacterium]|nr:hypothetical protein [Micropepsaceae bacterium]
LIRQSMPMIEGAGSGVIVLIRESRSTYVSDLLMRTNPQKDSEPLKDYGVGAQILLDLGVSEMVLLTRSPSKKIVGLDGYGLKVVEQRAITQEKGK